MGDRRLRRRARPVRGAFDAGRRASARRSPAADVASPPDPCLCALAARRGWHARRHRPGRARLCVDGARLPRTRRSRRAGSSPSDATAPIADARRDLYTHAFVLLAIASYVEATGATARRLRSPTRRWRSSSGTWRRPRAAVLSRSCRRTARCAGRIRTCTCSRACLRCGNARARSAISRERRNCSTCSPRASSAIPASSANTSHRRPQAGGRRRRPHRRTRPSP